MRSIFRSWRLAALLACIAGGPAAASDAKAVIELFTSQGCSSCPPADRLLNELAGDSRLVALSLPVDYWDYLGWRDTLALHSHSGRQKRYADQRRDRQVYTPQVVVNGITEAIGSDRHAIERAIAKAEIKSRLAIPILLTRKDASLRIEIAAGSAPGASVWVLGVTRSTLVNIKRGENRGKTIDYANVVRSWTPLGEWTGARLVIAKPIAELAANGADAAAVLLQEGSEENPGPIRGAAIIALR